MLSSTGRSASISDHATVLSILRGTPFEIVRQQAALRAFSDIRVQSLHALRDVILTGGDNTSFHSSVVEKIAADARAAGAVVATEVSLRQVQGGAGPRIDLILKLANQPLVFIDVKTGDRPRNTDYQEAWYPTIPIGGHLTADDPRIRQFGLIPGQPFPPSIFEYWTQRDANADAEVFTWRPRY